MKRGDNAFGGVIEEDRAHADADVRLEAMRVGKEWFELSDGLAFVIEYCPTTANPARRDLLIGQFRPAVHDDDAADCRISLRRRPGFSPDLLLGLSAEAVRIREAVLDFCPFPHCQIGV